MEIISNSTSPNQEHRTIVCWNFVSVDRKKLAIYNEGNIWKTPVHFHQRIGYWKLKSIK